MDYLKWYVYHGGDGSFFSDKGVALDECRYAIYRAGDIAQCSRKPKYLIGDYGFCTQHANFIFDVSGIEMKPYKGE